MEEHTYGVTELGRVVAWAVQRAFPDEVWVRGEIQNLSRPASGHVYFDLVDPEVPGRATLPVVLFESAKMAVNVHLQRSGAGRMIDGTEVRIRGIVDLESCPTPSGAIQRFQNLFSAPDQERNREPVPHQYYDGLRSTWFRSFGERNDTWARRGSGPQLLAEGHAPDLSRSLLRTLGLTKAETSPPRPATSRTSVAER